MIQAGPEYKELAVNDLETIPTTPAPLSPTDGFSSRANRTYGTSERSETNRAAANSFGARALSFLYRVDDKMPRLIQSSNTH